jgi:anti-sigma B factor antagonist
VRIEKTFVGDVAILELRGEFDTFECSRFSEEIGNLETLGINKVIVNFRFLRFINSTALGAIVKAKRTLTAKGGELIIAQPAKFVANVLDTLGLSEIIPMYDTEEEALGHFQAATKSSVDVVGDNVILFQFRDSEHSRAFGRSFGVGKIEEIEEERLRFKYEKGDKEDAADFDPKVLFAPGNELQLKFRLPFYRKAYYFECSGRIKRTQIAKDSIRVTAEFQNLAEDDRKSIQQFVADMRFLREEIRGTKEEE